MIFLRPWLTYVVQISMDSGLHSCFFSTTRVHLLEILSLSHGSCPHAFTSDSCVLPLSYKTKQNMNTSNVKVDFFKIMMKNYQGHKKSKWIVQTLTHKAVDLHKFFPLSALHILHRWRYMRSRKTRMSSQQRHWGCCWWRTVDCY